MGVPTQETRIGERFGPCVRSCQAPGWSTARPIAQMLRMASHRACTASRGLLGLRSIPTLRQTAQCQRWPPLPGCTCAWVSAFRSFRVAFAAVGGLMRGLRRHTGCGSPARAPRASRLRGCWSSPRSSSMRQRSATVGCSAWMRARCCGSKRQSSESSRPPCCAGWSGATSRVELTRAAHNGIPHAQHRLGACGCAAACNSGLAPVQPVTRWSCVHRSPSLPLAAPCMRLPVTLPSDQR